MIDCSLALQETISVYSRPIWGVLASEPLARSVVVKVVFILYCSIVYESGVVSFNTSTWRTLCKSKATFTTWTWIMLFSKNISSNFPELKQLRLLCHQLCCYGGCLECLPDDDWLFQSPSVQPLTFFYVDSCYFILIWRVVSIMLISFERALKLDIKGFHYLSSQETLETQTACRGNTHVCKSMQNEIEIYLETCLCVQGIRLKIMRFREMEMDAFWHFWSNS